MKDRNDMALFGAGLMIIVIVLFGLLWKAQSDRAYLQHKLMRCEAPK